MKSYHRLAAPGLLILMLGACSGSGEDPRITLCRNIAAGQTGTAADQWQAAGNRFVRPEYAVVSVSGPGQAECHYAYSAVEEGAMEHATPLLAYATLPFKVTVDGRELTGQALTRVVTGQQIAGVKATAGKVQQAADKAVQEAQKVIEAHSGN